MLLRAMTSHNVLGNVTHIYIPFEAARDNLVVHPVLKNIRLENGAVITRDGRLNNGLDLAGDAQYVNLGSFRDQCLGNLERCPHGVTLTFHTFPRDLEEGFDSYLLSGEAYDIVYSDGELEVIFKTEDKQWIVSCGQVCIKQQPKYSMTSHCYFRFSASGR